jgi:diadenosine tetraphosphate (Ap4A) HIT family hydrolase
MVHAKGSAIALRDAFPVSPGHTLIIPRRHVASYFEVTTVPHLHIHLIPRYVGDRDDPRGRVRWVLPDKAAYWNED